LAIGLTKTGCKVSAVYPSSGHSLEKTSVIEQKYPYRAIHPVRYLAEAIRIAKPDLVVPCDDRAVQHLHQLHRQEQGASDGFVRDLIERSLGNPTSYPTVATRYDFLKIAREEGLPVPETELVRADEDLRAWAERHPSFPWVLKADGTWGGHGVKIARNEHEAHGFLRQTRKPLSATRTLKRLVVDRDPYWMAAWWQHSTSNAIIQSFVDGRPANCAAVCWNGKVLAGISVEVICAQGETGSATIVQVVESPEMMRAAERMAARLGLSGFLGFDFVIEERTGTPYLIELNPRVTPLCHLQLGTGRDLVTAITTQLSGAGVADVSSLPRNQRIGYFPQAWHADRNSELLRSSFHDVPWDEPPLVRDLLRLPWPDRSMLARLSSRFRGLTFADRKARGGVFTATARESEVAQASKARNVQPRGAWNADPRHLSCVIPLHEGGGKPPLFLIPGVDGYLTSFHRLIRHMEPDRPIYGMLSQALLREEVGLTRVEQMAAYYLGKMQSVQPEGPYHLLGYSFGGYIAFEMARQLHAQRHPAGMVGLVDVLPMRRSLGVDRASNAPAANPEPAAPRQSGAAFHARQMLGSGGLAYARRKVRDRAVRTAYTLLDAAKFHIPPFLQYAYDLNWFAAVRYVPQCFPGRLTLFQMTTSVEERRASFDLWAQLATEGVDVRLIPGNHENIFDEPQVRGLAKEVTESLAEASARLAT
jgi:thioesterase domain-containing protein/predicted ATP-grasp superfamily ATP-dependent carboligase